MGRGTTHMHVCSLCAHGFNKVGMCRGGGAATVKADSKESLVGRVQWCHRRDRLQGCVWWTGAIGMHMCGCLHCISVFKGWRKAPAGSALPYVWHCIMKCVRVVCSLRDYSFSHTPDDAMAS